MTNLARAGTAFGEGEIRAVQCNDLGAQGDLELVMGGVSLNALYNEVALGRWVERKVLELKITPLVGAVLRNVCMSDRRITSLELATRYGDAVLRSFQLRL